MNQKAPWLRRLFLVEEFEQLFVGEKESPLRKQATLKSVCLFAPSPRIIALCAINLANYRIISVICFLI